MRGKTVNIQEHKMMNKLYDEGHSQGKIGKMLGRAPTVVRYHVNKGAQTKRCDYNYAYYRIKRCGGKDMKMVVFRRNGYLYMTNEENYNAMIEDASKITSLKDFDSFDQVVDYMRKYVGTTVAQFIDRTGDMK